MVRALPEKLYVGGHDPDGKMCVMEAVAYVAGEPWSDHPKCACPVLTAYCMRLNDSMPDEQRQRLLAYVPRLIGTRNPDLEVRRAFLAADHAVRIFAPLALEAVGLATEANKLRNLAVIKDGAAGDAAWAAGDAAGAAGDAAAWAARAAWAAGDARAAARAARDARAVVEAAEAAEAAANAAARAAWAAEARAAEAWAAALQLLDELLEIR